MKKIHYILTIAIFLLIVPLAYALEDFNAGSEKAAISICMGETFTDTVKISNIGNTYSEYKIFYEGDLAKYVTAVPNHISLMPGKTSSYSAYIHIPNELSGEHELITQIKTNMGVIKRFSQKINSQLCNNNYIVVKNFNQTGCSCQKFTYNFVVQNTGSFTETYYFGVDKFREFVNISMNPLILAPGDSALLSLAVNPPCDQNGYFLINLFSNAQISGIKTKVPLLLNINNCAAYDIVQGQMLTNDDKKYDANFIPYNGTYKVCAGYNKSIYVMIDNYAYVGDNFYYTLQGEPWASIYGNFIRLNGYEKGYTFIDANPTEVDIGEHLFVLNVEPQYGIKKQKQIDIEVEKCDQLILNIPPEASMCGCEQKEIPIQITNRGLSAESVSLSAEGADFVSVDPSNLKINQDQTKEAKLVIRAPCDSEWYGSITLKANTSKITDSEKINIDVYAPIKCYQPKIMVQDKVHLLHEKTAVPVTVENTGVKTADYTVLVNAASWIYVDDNKFRVSQNEKHAFNLILDPINVTDGTYYAEIVLSAGNASFSKKIKIDVSSRAGTGLIIKDFTYRYRYWLITGLIILIIIVSILVFAKKQLRIWQVKQLIRKTVNAENMKKVGKKQEKEERFNVFLVLFFAILAIFLIGISLMPKTRVFIVDYIWYFLVGLSVLVLLIFLIVKTEQIEK